VAVAIRSKTQHGSNLLLVSNGLSTTAAAAATNEAHRHMIHSTTTPSSEYITDDGLQVVCHRIHALYVLVVTPTSHNAFTAAAYLQHTVSLVIACCKTAEATAEKLAPRYAELYTALHSLIHHPAPSLSASAIASTSKKTAGLGVGTSKHASIKLPLRTTAKFEMPKGVLPEPTRVLRGAPPPPAERLASLGSLFPAAAPLVSVGTTPPVSPRRFDATPLLSPLPDALRATATPPLNDDPFAEANALAEAEHIPAFPSLTQPPRPAPDTFDLGTLDLTRMPAAMPKAPAASAPPSPTAENDPFLSMGHGVGTNAYPPNDNPFADAVEEHTAPVDRYAIAGSEGGVILTPSSSILPGTPEDLEIPETWDAIPGWGAAADPSIITAEVVDNMFSSTTPSLPLPLAPSASAPTASATVAGTATAEAALWVREAAALTVARGVATAIEVAGEIALTAVRPEHGVLPACTFALQGLDDLPVFELRVCEAHARYEEAKQLVQAKLSPQLEQSCIIAKYKAQTERMDGFPLQVRAVCCQLGKGTFALALMYSFLDNTDPASYRDMEFEVDTCVQECQPSKVHPAGEWVSYADGQARLRWRVPTLLNEGRPVRFRAIFNNAKAKELPGIWAPTVRVKCSRQAVCRPGESEGGTAALFSGVRLVR